MTLMDREKKEGGEKEKKQHAHFDCNHETAVIVPTEPPLSFEDRSRVHAHRRLVIPWTIAFKRSHGQIDHLQLMIEPTTVDLRERKGHACI